MESTYEAQASVKNGVSRMIFAVISILLEVAVILLLLYFAGQKAGWIYILIHILGTFLVLGIYGSYKTASIRMTWMLVIMLLPVFGTVLYLLIGLNGPYANAAVQRGNCGKGKKEGRPSRRDRGLHPQAGRISGL